MFLKVIRNSVDSMEQCRHFPAIDLLPTTIQFTFTACFEIVITKAKIFPQIVIESSHFYEICESLCAPFTFRYWNASRLEIALSNKNVPFRYAKFQTLIFLQILVVLYICPTLFASEEKSTTICVQFSLGNSPSLSVSGNPPL